MSEFQEIGASVLNAILLAALPTLAVALTGATLVWARKTWAEFRSTQPSVADLVAMYVRIGVEAAEQAGAAKSVANKKAYAMNVARLWLEKHGLGNVDIELISAEVERQVWAMKASQKIYDL